MNTTTRPAAWQTTREAPAAPLHPAPLTEEQRQQMRALLYMVEDALRHAETLAGRAADAMEGTDGIFALHEVRRAIGDFAQTSSALRGARDMVLPQR